MRIEALGGTRTWKLDIDMVTLRFPKGNQKASSIVVKWVTILKIEMAIAIEIVKHMGKKTGRGSIKISLLFSNSHHS